MIKLSFRMWILVFSLILAALIISPTFQKGMEIKSVDKNSVAFESGLRSGMKIEQINSQPIKSQEDYSIAAESFNLGESRISIVTNKGEFIFLDEDLSSLSVGEIPRTNIKTGLDLSGGSRALVKPVGVSLSSEELDDLVAITSNRLNVFGLSDLTVRPARDLEGNNYMLIEVAGATNEELRELVGTQGRFEAKIANQTVFSGGDKDISSVARGGQQALVTGCRRSTEDFVCEFTFAIYLREEAAERHATITSSIPLDETGEFLSEKLYLFIDGEEVDSLSINANLRGQKTTSISINGYGSGATQEEALRNAKEDMNKLQTILLTGSLPYELEIVKLDSISPSLGREFTRSMVLLAFIVFLVVSVVLFVKYRKMKITFAVILTMFSEAFITLGIAALLRWNIDAAGIAGIIAGMGTGVNDQIVIIDESKSGGNSSLKERIKTALFIIMGAFFTIVAAMLPLFWAGAGMLRGFAFTTIIGITVGILITRPAFADMIKRIEE